MICSFLFFIVDHDSLELSPIVDHDSLELSPIVDHSLLKLSPIVDHDSIELSPIGIILYPMHNMNKTCHIHGIHQHIIKYIII